MAEALNAFQPLPALLAQLFFELLLAEPERREVRILRRVVRRPRIQLASLLLVDEGAAAQRLRCVQARHHAVQLRLGDWLVDGAEVGGL